MNFLLDLLALGAIFSGIMVITSKNPVVSVLFLIAVFINVAGYLVLLGIAYLGLVYLIVYVGAVAILFLFVIMMLNLRLVELVDTGHEYTKHIPIAGILSSLFLFELVSILPHNFNDNLNNFLLETDSSASVYTPFDPAVIESAITPFTQVQSIGIALYTYSSL